MVLNSKMKKKCFFIGIVFLQILVYLFWGFTKTNYHWDEYYSLQYADSMGNDYKYTYIEQLEYYSENTWKEISVYKDYLTVDNDENILDRGIKGIADICTDRPYNGLINIIYSVFLPGVFNKWGALIFNIFLISIGNIFIYRLVIKLTDNNEYISNLIVLAYGLSASIISIVAYIRFYSLIMMLLAIVLYLHYLLYYETNFFRGAIYVAVSLACIYLCCEDSELVYVFGGGFIFLFSISLLFLKQYKKFFCYFFPIVIGALVLKWEKVEYYFSQVFSNNSTISFDETGPMAIMRRNAMNINSQELVKRIYNYIVYVGDYLFGSFYIFLLLLGLMFFLLILALKTRRKISFSKENVYVGVLASISIIYSVFSVITALWSPRYYSIMFMNIIIVMVLCIWKLGIKIGKEKYVNQCMTVILFVGIICSQILGNVENIYYEDKDTIARLESIDTRSNVIWNTEDRQILMDCVIKRESTDQVYVQDRANPLVYDDMPSEFILWINKNDDLSEKDIRLMQDKGYEIKEEIGYTYISALYLLGEK